MTEEALFELLSLECRVDEHGAVRYYNAREQLHRVYGPAIAYPDGYRAWWRNGQLHRVDGPAVERPNGYRAWYQNGRRHRVDGPAIVWSDGTYAWWLNGRDLTQAQWQREVAGMESV